MKEVAAAKKLPNNGNQEIIYDTGEKTMQRPRPMSIHPKNLTKMVMILF